MEIPWRCPSYEINDRIVLVVGIGGGCDVISALAVRDMLVSKYHPKEIYFGNTIGPRPLDECIELFSNVYRVPNERKSIDPNVTTYHSTLIEQSLPRDSFGCPLLFVVPHRENGTIEEITERNKEALCQSIKQIAKWDLIIGVDAGGDSLTGGIDFKIHPALGRDRQMLCVLASLGIRFYHFVIGPCCDGESSHALMKDTIERAVEMKFCLGSFLVDEVIIGSMEEHSKQLSRKRTTNIIVDSYRRIHRGVQGNITIPRGIEPNVPVEWMIRIVVFAWPQFVDPCVLLSPQPFAKV